MRIMIDATPENLEAARRVARIVRTHSDGGGGLSAQAIADTMNATGGLFDDAVDARTVRRMIELARAELNVLIVAAPGVDGGYRIPNSLADARAYVEQCRTMLMRYARLIAVTVRRADLVVGEQLALDKIAEAGMDEEAWAAVREHIDNVLTVGLQDERNGRASRTELDKRVRGVDTGEMVESAR